MRKTKITTVALIAGVLALTGCSNIREVDLEVAGAEPVPGLGGMFRLCDGPTLIYFTNYRGGVTDEYESFIPFGCIQGTDGRWVLDTTPPNYSMPPNDDGN